MSNKRRLPRGFRKLECLIDEWVLEDSRMRAEKRQSTPFDEIESFYERMLTRAPRALEYLRNRELGDLSKKDERLLKLMLALAEVGPAVEWYKQSGVVDGFDPREFRLTQQISDTARQEARP